MADKEKNADGHVTIMDDIESHPESQENFEDFVYSHFKESNPEYLEMLKRNDFDVEPEEDDESPEWHDQMFDEDVEDGGDEGPA